MPEISAEVLHGLVHENIEASNYRMARAWLNVLIELADQKPVTAAEAYRFAQARADAEDGIVRVPWARDPHDCEHGYATVTIAGLRRHISTGGHCTGPESES